MLGYFECSHDLENIFLYEKIIRNWIEAIIESFFKCSIADVQS